MTDQEITIKDAVLAAIRANSKTIDNLTPVTTIADSDSFEVSGGRRITFGHIKALISEMNDNERAELLEIVERADTALGGRIDAEATARQQADGSLGRRIDTEATLREGADGALGRRIDDEATARETADTALGGELAKVARVTMTDVNGFAVDSEKFTLRYRSYNRNTQESTQHEYEIPGATSAQAGLMTAADKSALDAVVADLADEIEAREHDDNVLADELSRETKKLRYATFGGVIGEGAVQAPIETAEGEAPAHSVLRIDYAPTEGAFVAVCQGAGPGEFVYHRTWPGCEAYNGSDGHALKGKLFLSADGGLYAVNGAGAMERIATSDDLASMMQTLRGEMSGMSAIGNAYNVTAERYSNNEPRPLEDMGTTYYDDFDSAVRYAWDKGVAAVGMQITFALADGSWKNYQYVGRTVGDANNKAFFEKTNWIDLAGMSAGNEPVLNINIACKGIATTLANDCYNLDLAIQAIEALEAKTGLTYMKVGLIITYKVATGEWETKQYVGNSVNDYTDFDNWVDILGSGRDNEAVETVDAPDADGTCKAFSAYGAHDYMPNDIEETEADDGESKTIQLKTRSGRLLGNAIRIPLKGGSSGGAVISISFKEDPVKASLGGTFKIYANIRSYDLTTETSNTIRAVSIIDDTTGSTIVSYDASTMPQSDDALWGFMFDMSKYITATGRRTFRVLVTDSEQEQKSKTVETLAVDATVVASQTLYKTDDSYVDADATSSYISLFKVPNVTTSTPATVQVDIWDGSEWKALATLASITKPTTTQGININPRDALGDGTLRLTHGSWPLRVQATDDTTGISGNTLYTAVMCIDKTCEAPIVSMRYNDTGEGKVQLYDTVEAEIAAYNPKTSTAVDVDMYVDGEKQTTLSVSQTAVRSYTRKVQGYSANGTDYMTLQAEATSNGLSGASGMVKLLVYGSAISAALKSGAVLDYDMTGRSNAESDHSIKSSGSNEAELTVEGANWSTNGFNTYLGESALAIKEGVTAEIPYKPFSSIGDNGMGLQFAIATANIADSEAKLMECCDATSGAGFYVKGNKVGIYVKGEDHGTQERSFPCGEKLTVAIVVEPVNNALTNAKEGTYSFMKMFFNGEEVASIGYKTNGSGVAQLKNITFDGTSGELYLYHLLAWSAYSEWQEAFDNYLVKVSDTDAMQQEAESEDVLDENGLPTLSSFQKAGLPYYIVEPVVGSFDEFDGGTSTSEKFVCNLYYHHPQKPWLSFVCRNAQWRRQGTTSAKRPVKNDRFYLAKSTRVNGVTYEPTVEAMFDPTDRSVDSGIRALINANLGEYEKACKLFAARYTQVSDVSIPVQVITVKVDYSDSSLANDCGVCDMSNAIYRSMGSDYMTPAQRAYDGTFGKVSGLELSGLQMDHSTKNHPIGAFRTTNYPNDVYFHARGNWKEDKGEQLALGFKDTPGYNLGCLNYGDFVELFGAEGETLAEAVARYKTGSYTENGSTITLDTGKLYLVSQYCGKNYAILEHDGTAWQQASGSMRQVGGKWVVTGKVLNPVTGFELLDYTAMDWWRGVSSVEDMMAPVTSKASWVSKLDATKVGETVPAWTQYFECMIDDDQLALDLANGKKVPYDLYRVLLFFNSVDHRESDGVTLRGASDLQERLAYFAANAWKYQSVESLCVYTGITDYNAAVDQWAKNMQPMFFLEDGYSVEDGVYSAEEGTRMYLNKVYDCDTCNGKDNEGAESVDAETDPFEATVEGEHSNPYAGWDSIMFYNVNNSGAMKVGPGTATLTLQGVVQNMRGKIAVAEDGTSYHPFGPDGAKYYFLTQRVEKWAKLIVSYDCENKYIKMFPKADTAYFYANHGSRRVALRHFIETRWNFRDGYYRTGDFTSTEHMISGRYSSGSDGYIRVTAAKDGYIGIGLQNPGSIDDAVYLKAGESYDFTCVNRSGLGNTYATFYIYQADRIKEIDLSAITITETNFGTLTLCEKITLGSNALDLNGKDPQRNLEVSALPFLREIDVTGSTIYHIYAGGCSRLTKVLAGTSPLQTVGIAETAPITTLTLPATMTTIKLVNLPNLSYPGGLSVGEGEGGFGRVTRIEVSGCPHIDGVSLLEGCVRDSAPLELLRMEGLRTTASVELLSYLTARGVRGVDGSGNAYDETGRCSGLTGRWILKEYVTDSEVNSLNAYFPELEVHNSQYSAVVFDDTVDDPANITNLDNGTSGDGYEASGHITRIRQALIPVKGKWDAARQKWVGQRLSDANYRKLANGDDFDFGDTLGNNFDTMMRCPGFWYKGVNDFKNQKKYVFWSSVNDLPLSSADTIRRAYLRDCVHTESASVNTENVSEGSSTLESGDVIVSTPNHNVYSFNVEGMKQVRWPGLNSPAVGAVFLDEDGVIVGKFNMAISSAMFDFSAGSDYVFCDVPANAKTIVFASMQTSNDLEVIAVDSDEVEAIEPDWVRNDPWLCGVYQGSVDVMRQYRSISNATVRTGTNTNATSSEWRYDADGRPTNMPVDNLNYTVKDLMNLAARRGAGYQLIDYEMSKLMALLWMSLNGTRDVQAACGYGKIYGGTTGYMDTRGNADSVRTSSNNGNKILGFESFVGSSWELMDNVAVNVVSYESFIRNHSVAIAADPIDAKWHIYDPITQTERVVQGVTNSGMCIGRVRNGRHCDVICSKNTTDYSRWTQNYCDAYTYSNSRCRVVCRSFYNATAEGGLVHAAVHFTSSNSSMYLASRLAFRGSILIEDE